MKVARPVRRAAWGNGPEKSGHRAPGRPDHLLEWEHLGETKLDNLVMLCKACHRLVHHAGWDVALVDGWPEFYPPAWIDPTRRPRRRPPPLARTG